MLPGLGWATCDFGGGELKKKGGPIAGKTYLLVIVVVVASCSFLHFG
jgi:hypothetical protein